MRKPLDVLNKYCKDLSSWDAESQVLFAMDTYAAIQAVEFAKWKDDNCKITGMLNTDLESIYRIMTHPELLEYTLLGLYQHWITNIYLKQQGA